MRERATTFSNVTWPPASINKLLSMEIVRNQTTFVDICNGAQPPPPRLLLLLRRTPIPRTSDQLTVLPDRSRATSKTARTRVSETATKNTEGEKQRNTCTTAFEELLRRPDRFLSDRDRLTFALLRFIIGIHQVRTLNRTPAKNATAASELGVLRRLQCHHYGTDACNRNNQPRGTRIAAEEPDLTYRWR